MVMKNFFRVGLTVMLTVLCVAAAGQMSDSLWGNKKVEKKAKPEKREKVKEKKAKAEKRAKVMKTERKDTAAADSGSMLPEVTKRTFRYKCFALNTDIPTQWLKDSLKENCKLMVTDMNWYETGDDVRFILEPDLDMTLQFMRDTTRLVTIQIGDIENMSIVQQLQQMVLKQMGDPTMGYELVRNYDGDDNTIWSDYTTYEFVYRYDIGNTTYDFRITQYGAKMKMGKVIHPYDFIATVSKHSDAPLSPAEAAALAINEENAEADNGSGKEATTVKSFEKRKRKKADYYPKVGVETAGGYSIETKMLKKW